MAKFDPQSSAQETPFLINNKKKKKDINYIDNSNPNVNMSRHIWNLNHRRIVLIS